MSSDRFVSRGGDKLQAALEKFQIDVSGKVILDVGSSTGGFVDCLLQNGAKKIYSVDTAYGELAWKLRQDPKIVVMERTNILHLERLPFVIPANAGIQLNNSRSELDPRLHGDDEIEVDLITIDAGWTKLELVLPVVKKFLKKDGQIIALLKPHYEAPEKTKKGVVPDELVDQVKKEVIKNITDIGFEVGDEIESPLLGSKGKGNKEFLLLITLE